MRPVDDNAVFRCLCHSVPLCKLATITA
jgi:hypothetical protein